MPLLIATEQGVRFTHVTDTIMSFTHKYIRERNFVLTLISGVIDDNEIKKHVQTLTIDTENMGNFVELADASNLHDISHLTTEGITIAAAFEIDRQPYNRDKLAILVSSDEAYELASNYAAITSYVRYGAKVFRDFRSAIEWLGVLDIENEIDELRND